MKLRGRTEAPAHGAEGAPFPSARGANQEALHGPLQRLLDAAGKLPASAFEFDQERMRLGISYVFN